MRNAVRAGLALVLALTACDRDPVAPESLAAPAAFTPPSASMFPAASLAEKIAYDVVAGYRYGAARDVNEESVAVGELCYFLTECQPARWTNGSPTLLPLATGTMQNRPRALNSSGVAVGYGNSTSSTGVRQFAIRWLPDGTAEVLSPTTHTAAWDINDAGYAVGTSFAVGGGGVIWSPPGGSVEHTSLRASGSASANAIDNAGQIVGYRFKSLTGHFVPIYWSSSSAVAQDLPLPAGFVGGSAEDVAEDGTIVGTVWTSNSVDRDERGVVWSSPVAQPLLLPKLADARAHCRATAINASGLIVGHCNNVPVLWADGQAHQLGSVARASALTDNGVVGIELSSAVAPFVLRLLADPRLTANAGGPYAAGEGAAITFDGTRSTPWPTGAALSYEWDFGDGTAGSGATPTHTYQDNGTYVVRLKVRVGTGLPSVAAVRSATISNVAPQITGITVPAVPVPLGTEVSVRTAFTGAPVDEIAATVTWDDGTVSTSLAVTSGFEEKHTYTVPGVYTVRVRLTDDDGSFDERPATSYIVVYDPSTGSFATGNGSIDSPAGAMPASPGASGRAVFGFQSRYVPGAQAPSGFTRFEFRAGALEFEATRFDWLVVAGKKAQFKGEGTIAGREGTFQFMLTAVDEGPGGPAGGDRFRIKITDAGGAVIYDNQLGASDGAAPATTITGGNITVQS